ncbi:MAG: hypothetical protein R3D98_12980 [Candidatus Krumholzibacteriia bacterium]
MTGLPSINLTTARGAMASRRGGNRPGPLWLALAGVAITLILAVSIQIAGEVTALREANQALARRCDELAARGALLSVRWNTESSRQVVMRRAQRELELESPDTPATLLVAAPVEAGHERSGLLALDLGAYGVPAAVAGERP